MLKQRTITAIFIMIIVLSVLLFSYIPYVTMSFAALLGILAVHELYTAAGMRKKWWAYALSMLAAVAVPFIRIPHYNIVLTVLFVVAVILFSLLMKRFGSYTIKSVGTVLLISLLFPFFFSSIIYLRSMQGGLYGMILLLMACISTDTAAYFIGSALGRHKLAEKISPKKTVEGFIGGLFFSSIMFLSFGIMLRVAYSIEIDLFMLTLLGLLCGAVDQFGDLSMSVLKRNFKVKDFGKIMPGHGGVLDRFDSMMFVAPLIYIVASFDIGLFVG